MPLSAPMVRVPGEQCYGAIKLLGHHDAHELMRPRHGAEGQHKIGAGSQRLAVPVRAADGHGQSRATAIAELLHPRGERLAADGAAALVQHHQCRAGGNVRAKRSGFLVAPGIGARRAALREFDHVETRQSQSRSGFGSTVQIARRKVALRAGLEPAHGTNNNAQGLSGLVQPLARAGGAAGVSTDHIFSRL